MGVRSLILDCLPHPIGEETMETALSLWGYEIPGKVALILIGAYIVISVILIWLAPKISIPWPRDKADGTKYAELTADDLSKFIETRSKVRTAIIQVAGGIAAVLAFVTAVQQLNSNEDAFRQKKADLFAKSVKELLADDSKPDSRAEALYILSYIARGDRSYHRAVYDVLATYVTDSSEAVCKDERYRSADFHRDRTIQLAIRILGERKIDDEQTAKRLNLEGSCLVGLDLLDEWGVIKGLAKARLSGAKMLRIDFGRVDLQNAQLMGIDAGDYLNPGWTAEIGRRLHKGDDGDPRIGTDDGNERRRFVSHFIDANLQGADFTGAGLQGADFSGATLKDAIFDRAVISRASFKGAQQLTAKQFELACVGRPGLSEDELKLEQPYFSPDLRTEIKNSPKLQGRIATCR
jgi:uncharacterized protein YjbI with pentapeptide repeats